MADTNSEKEAKDKLISWLQNAHAMEHEVAEILKKHIEDVKNEDGDKKFQKKLEEHHKITLGHAEKVKKCLQQLDADVSDLKSGAAKIMGNIEGMSSEVFSDKLIVNSIAELASENFEIGVYQTIFIAAQILEEEEIIDAVEGILEEEIEMAEWLQDNMPQQVEDAFAY